MPEFSVMPDAAAWQAFGGVCLIIMFLGAAKVGLRRLGYLPPVAPVAPVAAAGEAAAGDPIRERVRKTEEELVKMRILMAEEYVRRDDYVSSQSRTIGLLEAHSVMLARMEERIAGMRQ